MGYERGSVSTIIITMHKKTEAITAQGNGFESYRSSKYTKEGSFHQQEFVHTRFFTAALADVLVSFFLCADSRRSVRCEGLG